jgi:hypothetical protein
MSSGKKIDRWPITSMLAHKGKKDAASSNKKKNKNCTLERIEKLMSTKTRLRKEKVKQTRICTMEIVYRLYQAQKEKSIQSCITRNPNSNSISISIRQNLSSESQPISDCTSSRWFSKHARWWPLAHCSSFQLPWPCITCVFFFLLTSHVSFLFFCRVELPFHVRDRRVKPLFPIRI